MQDVARAFWKDDDDDNKVDKNRENFTKETENLLANSLAKHSAAVTLADLLRQNLIGRIMTRSNRIKTKNNQTFIAHTLKSMPLVQKVSSKQIIQDYL